MTNALVDRGPCRLLGRLIMTHDDAREIPQGRPLRHHRREAAGFNPQEPGLSGSLEVAAVTARQCMLLLGQIASPNVFQVISEVDVPMFEWAGLIATTITDGKVNVGSFSQVIMSRVNIAVSLTCEGGKFLDKSEYLQAERD